MSSTQHIVAKLGVCGIKKVPVGMTVDGLTYFQSRANSAVKGGQVTLEALANVRPGDVITHREIPAGAGAFVWQD